MSDFAYEERSINITEYRAPGPVARRFLTSSEFIRFIMGPMGSGKTTLCLFDGIEKAFAMPKAIDGNRYFSDVVIRDTYTNLWNTTIRSWNKFFPQDVGRWSGGKNRPAEHVLKLKDARDGSFVHYSIRFTALSDQSVEDALRGAEYTRAYVNEADLVAEDVLTYLIGRVGRYPDTMMMGHSRFWHGIVGDVNPPDTDSYIYRDFVEDLKELRAFFIQPGGRAKGAENVSNLPEGYYERLAAANASKKWWVQRMVDGKFGYSRDGQPVYECFDDDVHVADEPLKADPNIPLLLAFDQGIMQPAMAVLQYMPIGQFRMIAEYAPGRMSPGTFGRNCRALVNERFPGVPLRNMGVCDPAGMAGEIREEAHFSWASIVSQELGLPLIPAETNELDPRIEVLTQLLTYMPAPGVPGFLLSPDCPMMRKAMNSHYRYRRKQGMAEEYEPRPQKNIWANIVEACQYGALHIFGLQGVIGGGVREGKGAREGENWSRQSEPNPTQTAHPGEFDVFGL